MTPPDRDQQVRRFKKKQVEVEAIQWTGDRAAMVAWLQRVLPEGANRDKLIELHPAGHLRVFTPGGYMLCGDGEWLVLEPFPKLRERLLYPVRPDIFEATYEVGKAVEEEMAKALAADRWGRIHGPRLREFEDQTPELRAAWIENVRVDLAAIQPFLVQSEGIEHRTAVLALKRLVDAAAPFESATATVEDRERFSEAFNAAVFELAAQPSASPQPEDNVSPSLEELRNLMVLARGKGHAAKAEAIDSAIEILNKHLDAQPEDRDGVVEEGTASDCDWPTIKVARRRVDHCGDGQSVPQTHLMGTHESEKWYRQNGWNVETYVPARPAPTQLQISDEDREALRKAKDWLERATATGSRRHNPANFPNDPILGPAGDRASTLEYADEALAALRPLLRKLASTPTQPVQFTCCGYDEMSPESQKAVRELVEIVAATSDPSLLSDEERARYAEARQSIVDARAATPTQQGGKDGGVGEGDDEYSYLCFNCGSVTAASEWTGWQRNHDEDAEDEYRPNRPGETDPLLKCPRCGEMHGDCYVGAGLEDGTRAALERERAMMLANEPEQEREWADALAVATEPAASTQQGDEQKGGVEEALGRIAGAAPADGEQGAVMCLSACISIASKALGRSRPPWLDAYERKHGVQPAIRSRGDEGRDDGGSGRDGRADQAQGGGEGDLRDAHRPDGDDPGRYGRHLREVVAEHRKEPLSEQRVHARRPASTQQSKENQSS